MSIDESDFEKVKYVPSSTPIPEGDLRAYIFAHDIYNGAHQIVVLARSQTTAKGFYLLQMDTVHRDDSSYGVAYLEKIIEKPFTEGVLCDFHCSE